MPTGPAIWKAEGGGLLPFKSPRPVTATQADPTEKEKSHRNNSRCSKDQEGPRGSKEDTEARLALSSSFKTGSLELFTDEKHHTPSGIKQKEPR